MGFAKVVLALLFLHAVVIHCWHWEVYETKGKICDPAPIGVPAYSEKQCQDKCAATPNIKFCQFNIVTHNWCMMGTTCKKQWLHPTHRYIVWVKVEDKPGHGDCIKLVHGEKCTCKSGNCDSGKVDIKKWLGGKCGAAVKHIREKCDPKRCGPSFSKKMMTSAGKGFSWQYNWGRHKCPWDYPKSVKYVPQFWGAQAYDDFPQLKLDGNFQPTKENYALPIVLGFNEPDLTGRGASSMSPETAVKYWKKNVVNAIKKGFRQFVSPAMALALPQRYNKRTGGTEWLPKFLNLLARERRHHENVNINGKTFKVEIDWKTTVDYVAVHKYEGNCQISDHSCYDWDVDVNTGAAKRMMEEYNRKGFNIKGVWLTEFAGAGRAHCATLQQQKALLEKWVPYLLKDDKVTAISWFSYDGDHSPYYSAQANLWDYKSQKPSVLGRKYFELCSKHRY